jgi:hypothetical protein
LGPRVTPTRSANLLTPICNATKHINAWDDHQDGYNNKINSSKNDKIVWSPEANWLNGKKQQEAMCENLSKIRFTSAGMQAKFNPKENQASTCKAQKFAPFKHTGVIHWLKQRHHCSGCEIENWYSAQKALNCMKLAVNTMCKIEQNYVYKCRNTSKVQSRG